LNAVNAATEADVRTITAGSANAASSSAGVSRLRA
jgi:hypothetical protein